MSILTSDVETSVVAFPAESVTIASTLYIPSDNASPVGITNVHVVPVIVSSESVRVYTLPSTITERVSQFQRVTSPVILGVSVLYKSVSTVAALGKVVSTSMSVVEAVLVFPAVSV